MSDFFFVVKCFFMTVVIVVLLQIKVGGRTLEAQTVRWIHRSGLIHQLQNVAEGAVKAGKVGAGEIATLFKEKTDDIDDLMPRSEASKSWFKVKSSGTDEDQDL